MRDAGRYEAVDQAGDGLRLLRVDDMRGAGDEQRRGRLLYFTLSRWTIPRIIRAEGCGIVPDNPLKVEQIARR